LFGTHPDSDIFREIYPANCPGGINKKLRRAGNIGAFRSCAGMQQIVTTNDFRLGIGKERVGETQFLPLATIISGGSTLIATTRMPRDSNSESLCWNSVTRSCITVTKNRDKKSVTPHLLSRLRCSASAMKGDLRAKQAYRFHPAT
jgi:hypothetical protein